MSNFENEKKALIDATVAYQPKGIDAAVKQAMAVGMPATAIIDALGEGMTKVGQLFERSKLFLPQVLSAANGMSKAVVTLEPELKKNSSKSSKKGTAVMGTVEGDVHDIGKSIVSIMLQCQGFEIHDLGRDVPREKYIDEVRGGCDFCGMSSLMTTTMVVQKDVIELLKKEGLRDKVTVMVGGAPATQYWADKIGADIYGENASEGVQKALAIVGRK